MGIAHCKKCDNINLFDADFCKHCGVKNPLAFKYRLDGYIAACGLFLFVLVALPFIVVWALGCEMYWLYKRYIRAVQKLKTKY